jgi:hypothetical protein
MTKRHWKFVSEYPITGYKCGLKAGDLLRLKCELSVSDSNGQLTGEAHPAGEIWTVLPGSADEADIVWLRQPDGNRHTWDDDSSIFETFEKLKKQYCACCGYDTLIEPPGTGTFDICPICFWEDDPVQFKDPHRVGGANECSLKEARRNFERFGVSDQRHAKDVRPPNAMDFRNPDWTVE